MQQEFQQSDNVMVRAHVQSSPILDDGDLLQSRLSGCGSIVCGFVAYAVHAHDNTVTADEV